MGKQVRKILPVPDEIIVNDRRLVVIHKGVLQAIQVGNNRDEKGEEQAGYAEIFLQMSEPFL